MTMWIIHIVLPHDYIFKSILSYIFDSAAYYRKFMNTVGKQIYKHIYLYLIILISLNNTTSVAVIALRYVVGSFASILGRVLFLFHEQGLDALEIYHSNVCMCLVLTV